MNLSSKWLIAILVIITLWGGYLRFHDLGSQSLWIDEVFSIQAGQAVVENGEPRFETGAFYRNHLLNSYITAGVLSLSTFDALNPWQVRSPSAVFGTLLIPLFYLFILLLTKRHSIAIMSSALVAFSTLEIGWSRQVRGYAAEQFFAISSFIFLWLYLKKDKVFFAIISGILVSLAAWFHLLSIAFVPAIVAIVFLKILEKKKITYKEIVLLLTLVPIVWYAASLKVNTLVNLKYYLEYFFTDILIVTLLFILGALITLFKKDIRKENVFLLLATLVPIAVFVFSAPIAHSRYLVIVLPFVFYFCTAGIFYSVEYFFKDIKIRPVKQIFFIFLTILLLSNQLNFVTQDKYHLGFDSPQPNFKEAYEFIEKNIQEGDTLITAYPYVTELYIGEPGLWIPFSISGNPTEHKWITIKGKERVTGADILRSDDEIINILENKSGFILVDQLMLKRITEKAHLIGEHPSTKLVYRNKEVNGEIWVFEYGRNN